MWIITKFECLGDVSEAKQKEVFSFHTFFALQSWNSFHHTLDIVKVKYSALKALPKVQTSASSSSANFCFLFFSVNELKYFIYL